MDRRCIICGEVPQTAFTYPHNVKEAFKWQSLLKVYVPAETLRHHCCICQKHVGLPVTQQGNQQQKTLYNRCSGGHMGRTRRHANNQRLSVSFNDSDAIHYFGQIYMNDELDEHECTHSKLKQKSGSYSQKPNKHQIKESGFNSSTSNTTIESAELSEQKNNLAKRYTSGYERCSAISNDNTTCTCSPCCSQRENQTTGFERAQLNTTTFSQQGNSSKFVATRNNAQQMKQSRKTRCSSETCKRKNLTSYDKQANNHNNHIKEDVNYCNACRSCSDKDMQQKWQKPATSARTARVQISIPNVASSNRHYANGMQYQCCHEMNLQNQQQISQRSQECQCCLPCTNIHENMTVDSSLPSVGVFNEMNSDFSLCSDATCCADCPGAEDKNIPMKETANSPPAVNSIADNPLPVPVNVLIMGGSMLPTYCNTSKDRNDARLESEMCVLETDFTKERAVFPDIDEPQYTVCRPTAESKSAEIPCQSMEQEESSTEVLLLGMAQSKTCICAGHAGSKRPSQEASMPLQADLQNGQTKDLNYQQIIQYQRTRIDELGGLVAQQEKIQQNIMAKLNEMQAKTKSMESNEAAKPTSTPTNKSSPKTKTEIPRANAGTSVKLQAYTHNPTFLYAMPGTSKPNTNNLAKTAAAPNPMLKSNQSPTFGAQKAFAYNMANPAVLLPKQIGLNPMIRVLPTIASYKAK